MVNIKLPKVLLFIKLPPPITGATSINNYIYNFKKLREKFHVRTISMSYSLSVEELGKIKFSKILVLLKVWIKLIKILFSWKPDIIYFQISPLGTAFLRDLIYVLAIKAFKVKILYHLHGKGISQASKSNFKKRLYEYAFKNCEIICLSGLLSNDIDNVFNGEIHIVNNGIPEVNYPITKSQNNANIKILFLSNLIMSKGIIDYIAALEIIKNRGIDFEAYIVGNEGNINSQQLAEEIRSKGLSKDVRYLGPKYNDKTELLGTVDLLVYPSTNDAFPLVILEAMQAELPVIGTCEGAIPEIIDDGVTGYLVNKKSPEEIAEKLGILIKNPELRKKMGEAGRKKYLENYILETFEQNMLNVFRNVLTNDLRNDLRGV